MTTARSAPAAERRFDRASWLTVAIVLGFFAACALVAALVLSQPGDGCLLDAGSGDIAVHACVSDWETPLRPGDRVLAVASVSMHDGSIIRGAADRLEGQAQEATSLPYTVERAGTSLELRVPLGRLGGWGLLRAFGTGLAFYAKEWLVYIFMGAAIIFTLAPRARAAQLLLVASGGGAAVTTLAWTAESVAGHLFAPAPLYYSLALLQTFWNWLLVPTLVLLVLSFPRRVWPLARWPRATPSLIYGGQVAAIMATALTSQSAFYLGALALGALTLVVATIAVPLHTYWRVRDPVVRAQTAWMSLGLMVGIGIWPLLFIIGEFIPPVKVALDQEPDTDWMIQLFTTGSFSLCLGIAITRYRLFDIDIVINRALVYTLLTGTLAAVYFGGVVLVQGALRTLTGQESELAIVAATLAVAALFQPLRGRSQALIDRLFFRRKYDAARTLAAYGAALRDDVDVERVSAELLGVVGETVQPAHASLWLREP
jgi:hypothetical protein